MDICNKGFLLQNNVLLWKQGMVGSEVKNGGGTCEVDLQTNLMCSCIRYKHNLIKEAIRWNSIWLLCHSIWLITYIH